MLVYKWLPRFVGPDSVCACWRHDADRAQVAEKVIEHPKALLPASSRLYALFDKAIAKQVLKAVGMLSFVVSSSSMTVRRLLWCS